jgi:hypothetical protein
MMHSLLKFLKLFFNYNIYYRNISNLWFSLFNSFYMYFIPVVKPNLVLQLLHLNFMYQRVLNIKELCMFEKNLLVNFF